MVNIKSIVVLTFQNLSVNIRLIPGSNLGLILVRTFWIIVIASSITSSFFSAPQTPCLYPVTMLYNQAPARPWVLTAHQAPNAPATRWGSGWPALYGDSALAKQMATLRSSPTSTRRTAMARGRTWTPCMALRRTLTTVPQRHRTRRWRK